MKQRVFSEEKFIHIAVLLLSCVALSLGQPSKEDVNRDTVAHIRPFKFGWITDTHVGAGFTEGGLQGVISDINGMSEELDFIINTGDLTEKGLNAELTQYKNIISNCHIPIWNIPGNHDTKWTESGLEKYKQFFGPVHFSFHHNGFQFIGINSGIPLRGGGGYFDPAEIVWLENELGSMGSPDTPVIIAWHHPGDFGSISNYWKILDLLKDYNTALIMVGHGHHNAQYDFEGIAGAMGLDTYGEISGFNIVSVTPDEIIISTHLTNDETGDPWYIIPITGPSQTKIYFPNLGENAPVSGTKTFEIQLNQPATNGIWDITYDDRGAQPLSGRGTSWNFTLNTANLENGYHTLTVSFTEPSGRRVSRTRGFYVENGYPRAIWRFHAGAGIITAPAYDDNHAYVGTSDGRIIGLNLSDGSLAWEPVQTQGTVFSSPAVSDSIIYIGSSDGYLYAVNASSGSIQWRYETGSAILTPPIIADSLIYFGSGNNFYALNLNTHEQAWGRSINGMMECKPVLAGDYVIFTAWDRSVHALNRFTGASQWNWSRTPSFYYSPGACWPVVGLHRVFVTDPQRYTSAINLENGETIWSHNSPEAWESVGISSDKTQVYIRSLDGNLYAFSAAEPSMQQIWSAPVGYGWDSIPSMPVEKNGSVFTGSKKGFVTSVDSKDGQVSWRYWTAHAYVATVTPLDEDRVLVTALDGTVILISGDPALGVEE
ncbi:PQQ-binding-like beta-propeller repeat protein [candidate division KSB1 bacterium]|nr:PQQ-binding-like beta-propeller repeat protein [candidate division KSB1 bacterium]